MSTEKEFKMQYTLVGTDDGSNITVILPGRKPLVAHSTHPNYDAILKKVMEGDETAADLFDVAQTAVTKFQRLTERITTANGKLYLDGVEVANALADQVVRFLQEDVDDWKPLVAFFENVQSNPNEHSREQLYDWLSKRDFTITEKGMIVGYKGVNNDLTSVSSGTAIVNGEVVTGQIPNQIGSVIEMPRDQVTHDPSQGCHQGLHVGAHSYASWFGSVMLEVHVNPRDVVSVPTHSSWEKMRVCRYVVVGQIEKKYDEAVIQDYDPDDFCPICGVEDCDDEACEESETEVEDLESDGGAGANVGDKFLSADARRDATFVVESFETDNGVEYAIGKSMPRNLTRKVRVDRLLSYRYRKVA